MEKKAEWPGSSHRRRRRRGGKGIRRQLRQLRKLC
jgi:hypothetical protein